LKTALVSTKSVTVLKEGGKLAAELTGQELTEWKLTDNSVAEVTKAELEEALVLSIKQVSIIVGAITEGTGA
jgi:hypothetical protein